MKMKNSKDGFWNCIKMFIGIVILSIVLGALLPAVWNFGIIIINSGVSLSVVDDPNYVIYVNKYWNQLLANFMFMPENPTNFILALGLRLVLFAIVSLIVLAIILNREKRDEKELKLEKDRYETLLCFINRGSLEHEDEARKIAKRNGFSVENLDVRLKLARNEQL